VKKRWALLGALVAAGVGLDQATKYLAHAHLRGHGVKELVPGVLDLFYVRNPGAFRSLGAELDPDLRRVLFIGASLGASALILRLYATAEGLLRWGLVCLLAGALGNLIDRALYGEVIDFLHVSWWATFNIADVWITAGLGILVVDLVRGRAVLRESRS
jgi:signal peptidase II